MKSAYVYAQALIVDTYGYEWRLLERELRISLLFQLERNARCQADCSHYEPVRCFYHQVAEYLAQERSRV